MMNKKEIFRKIGGIISEVTEQYQYLSDNFEDFNELELELFAANAHFLTEHIEILKKFAGAYKPDPKITGSRAPEIEKDSSIQTSRTEKLADKESNAEVAEIKAEKQSNPEKLHDLGLNSPDSSSAAEKSLDDLYASDFAEETTSASSNLQHGQNVNKDSEPESAPAIAPKPLPSPAPVQPAPVTIPTPSPESTPAPVPSAPAAAASPDTRPTEPVVNTVVIPEKEVQVENNTSAEKESPGRTLNDVISAQVNRSNVSTAYTRQTTDDLKSIISLNDKLMFIKELFNGYSLAYSEAIEILNRFESLEAAENFLRNNYAEKNQWVTRQNAVDKFFKLLERRYSK